MITIILFLSLSLILLIKSADFFVEYSSRIAKRLGVSEFGIGLTLVALGTSLPELGSGIYSAYLNKTGLVLGNIVGSNIANIGIVLGVGLLLTSIKISRKMLKSEGIFLTAITCLFLILLYTGGGLDWIEGIVLLVFFFAYMGHNLMAPKDKGYLSMFNSLMKIGTFRKLRDRAKDPKEGMVMDILIIILCMAGIYFGSKYTVINSIALSELAGLSELAIGFIVIGLGTSLPELSVSISSGRRGFGGIVLGNVIGSNIINMLLVGGASAMFTPIPFADAITLLSMLVITVLLLFFMKNNLDKRHGMIFIAIYIIITAWLLSQGFTHT